MEEQFFLQGESARFAGELVGDVILGVGFYNLGTRGLTQATKKIDKLDEIYNWLGDGTRVITNKHGDKVFLSKDGTRKFRTDVFNPHGYDPHVHFEVLKNGDWVDLIPGRHHIYIKK